MADNPKRDAFMQRIKVNPSTQTKAVKKAQFSSNNKSSSASSNKASAVDRQRAIYGGRGNER